MAFPRDNDVPLRPVHYKYTPPTRIVPARLLYLDAWSSELLVGFWTRCTVVPLVSVDTQVGKPSGYGVAKSIKNSHFDLLMV